MAIDYDGPRDENYCTPHQAWEAAQIRKSVEEVDRRQQPTEEDKAWEEQKHLNDIQARNRAHMAAWCAAGVYITDNAEKLGRISIRQAYEQGFIDGYKKKGEDNGCA